MTTTVSSRTAAHRPAVRPRRFRHDTLVAVDLFSGFGGLTRAIAAASHGRESDAVWTSPNHSTCDLIGTAAEGIAPRVLLVDVKGA